MTKPPATCYKCGAPLANVRLQAELAAVAQDGDVAATQRNFLGDCPEHGTVFAWHIGNHSTLGEKELRRRYPKATYKCLMGLLPREDADKFSRAFHGKYKPTPGDIDLWDRYAVDAVPPTTE